MRMRRTFLLALPAAMLLASCGGKVIDDTDAESLIKHASHGVAASADCPSDVDAKQGRTFQCSAVLKNGEKRTVTVKIGRVSGDRVQLGLVTAKPAK